MRTEKNRPRNSYAITEQKYFSNIQPCTQIFKHKLPYFIYFVIYVSHITISLAVFLFGIYLLY